MTTAQHIHDIQKQYVEDLAKILPWERGEIWKLARLLWPRIERLDDHGDTARFKITMSPAANTLGALLCGDHNATFHTGSNYLQTLTLVGMCSAITSAFLPGYALARIDAPVEFRTPVPIGAAIIMTATPLGERGDIRIFDLDGEIESSGQTLFSKPRKLIMSKISI